MLITGAAGGLGRCLADRFAQAGCVLILTDIDRNGLGRTADGCRRIAQGVDTYTVDVTRRKDVAGMAADVIRRLGDVDILINNAGLGHVGEMVDTPIRTWKTLMDVDFWGPMYHVYAFLPSMIRRRRGHIVNISSGQAFYRLPTWGPYTTVKLALGAFSEMLGVEIRKFGLKVTTVYPFIMNTEGFYKGLEGETFLSKLSLKWAPRYSMTPERVAAIIFRAVKREKPVEMVTPLNWIGFYARLAPPVIDAVNKAAFRLLGKAPGAPYRHLADDGTA